MSTVRYAYVDQPTLPIDGCYFWPDELPLMFVCQPTYGRVLLKHHYIVIPNNYFQGNRKSVGLLLCT